MQRIADLKNLGPKSQTWLNAIGVHNRADLQAVGPVATYTILRQQGYLVTLNLLYAMQAALLDMHWTALPPDIKTKLKNSVTPSEKTGARR